LVKLAFADYHILYKILTKNTTMFLELTEDKLQEIINSNAKVMVQYGASWCGNCRIMKPKFKKLAENEDVPFYYVDAEKLPESRKLANVDNLPTFAAFEGGQLKNQVQTNKAEVLNELFNEIKA
jgi:thiol-disulfide isomerase/thioredoxin